MPIDRHDEEVYAGVGLALRWAQEFETELVNVAFLHGIARNCFKSRREAAQFIEQQDRRPTKQLLREVLKHVRFEPDVSSTLEQAIDDRNEFVHRFYWDHMDDFLTPRGREIMKERLRELTQLFFSAQKFASMLTRLYLKQVDLPEESRRELIAYGLGDALTPKQDAAT